jgi:hypothetical protein
MTKRTDKELWDALDEATLDAELESALAKTPEDHRKSLEEAGYDLAKVDAEADAFFASLKATSKAETPAVATNAVDAPAAPVPAPAPVANIADVPARRKRARPMVVIPVVLALAAGMALTVQMALPPEPVGSAPPETPVEHARTLRLFAQDACEQQHWRVCLGRLDQARVLDPTGDEAADVQSLRHKATAGLGHP